MIFLFPFFPLFFILSFQSLLQTLNREKYTVSYSDKRSFGAVCRRMLFMEISLASICVEKQFDRSRGLFALAQSIWWDVLPIECRTAILKVEVGTLFLGEEEYLFEAVTIFETIFLLPFFYWERKRKNYSKLIILQIFGPTFHEFPTLERVRVISTWAAKNRLSRVIDMDRIF